jgi:hypothetical protein
LIRSYARLFQDGAQRAFGHVARMIGNGGVATCAGIELDLVAAGGLTVELKPERFESWNDLAEDNWGQA